MGAGLNLTELNVNSPHQNVRIVCTNRKFSDILEPIFVYICPSETSKEQLQDECLPMAVDLQNV